MTDAGVSRGPGVEQVSPDPERGVASPLPFKVRFIARNNIAIDPASVKVTYLKAQLVDLTDRIKKHLTPDGIEIANADIPPGTHHMRISLRDNQGRSTRRCSSSIVAPAVARARRQIAALPSLPASPRRNPPGGPARSPRACRPSGSW